MEFIVLLLVLNGQLPESVSSQRTKLPCHSSILIFKENILIIILSLKIYLLLFMIDIQQK